MKALFQRCIGSASLQAFWQRAGVPLLALALAAAAGAGILAAAGADPLRAYAALLRGALGSADALGRTLQKATPLLFGGLSVALAFRAGLFNIGAQGQLLVGGLAAAAAGAGLQGLPPGAHLACGLLAGMAAGGAWGWVQGILKTATGAHEVITGIMFNYVAINLTDYLAAGPLRDPTPGSVLARTALVPAEARLPALGEIPAGFLLALAGAWALWWILRRTTPGFSLRTVGLSPEAARCAGIRVGRVAVLTMFFSGVLAGLGGAVESLGVIHRFQPGFNAGLGFEGITVALLGRTHPMGVAAAALLVGAMKAGAGRMQLDAGVGVDMVDVLLALLLLFVAMDTALGKLFSGRGAAWLRPVLSRGWGRH